MSIRGNILATASAGVLHLAVMLITVELDRSVPEPVVRMTVPPPEPDPPPDPAPEPESKPEPPPPEPEPKPAPKPRKQPRQETPPEPPTEPPPPDPPPDPPPPAEVPDIDTAPNAPAAPKVAKSPPRTRAKADMNGYGRGIHGAIMSQRRYPAAAKRLGLEGTAKVKLVIDRSGRLKGKPQLVKSSGHAVLDDEALAMVERSAPFPSLPVEFDKDVATIVIPVRFALK